MSDGGAHPSLTLRALTGQRFRSEARSVSDGRAHPSLTLRALTNVFLAEYYV